ncbi:hypothetical protein L218DRAFT_947755 [Marasmius fiardii PR-910]|nr:hypothetical protein L218DRAFT_947755 [Marasmius fiardii PR-910]
MSSSLPGVSIPGDEDRKSFEFSVVSGFIVTAVHFLLYGLYIALFRSSLRLIKTRALGSARGFHRISLTLLFIVVSLDVPIGLACDVLRVVVAYLTKIRSVYPKKLFNVSVGLHIARGSLLLILMSTVDIILSQRKLYPGLLIGFCTLINLTEEDTQRRIGVGSGVMAIDNYLADMFIGFSALINFTLTSVLAGRIWWLSRRGRADHSEKFNVVVAIILESGLFYIFGLAIFIGGPLANPRPFFAGSVLFPIGGITPTLIVAAQTERQAQVIWTIQISPD